jgi:hypothetical protein
MNFTTNNRLMSGPAVALLSLTMLLSGATQPLLAVPDPPGKAALRSGGIFPASMQEMTRRANPSSMPATNY